ncbi:hypothetical protein P0082_06545 [Candidatus Haliotispira prima]|uniref:Uncharacterized protein n=1 Tax=Candidatus Haliotispira prima TaxID=3034016 RepID=A0ABY8MF08_9SPIO|nr:hypothetical protein P0082_06545 [Candidatus Haliotispira prima]
MKRTELERRDREVKRSRKKEEVLERKASKETGCMSRTVGECIDQLEELFFHDETKIYNINHSVEILELIEELKETFSQDKLDSIIRKAIKKTGVKEKAEAQKEIENLLS